MSWGDAFWWPHRVIIAPMLRGGARGPRLGDPRETVAEVDDSFRLVRTTDAREVTSSARVTIPIGEPFAAVELGSEVTLWPGRAGVERTSIVVAISREENDPPLASQLVLSLE